MRFSKLLLANANGNVVIGLGRGVALASSVGGSEDLAFIGDIAGVTGKVH